MHVSGWVVCSPVCAPLFTGGRLLPHKGQNATAGGAVLDPGKPSRRFPPSLPLPLDVIGKAALPALFSSPGCDFGEGGVAGPSSTAGREASSQPPPPPPWLCLSAEPLEKPSPGIQGSMDIEMQLKPFFFFSQRLAKPPGRTLPGGSRSSPALKGATLSRRDPRHLQQHGPLKQARQTRPL